MKTYWGSGGIDPRILNLCTRWRWVVSFTPRSLCLRGKSLLYPLVGGWVGPIAGLGRLGEEKKSQRM